MSIILPYQMCCVSWFGSRLESRLIQLIPMLSTPLVSLVQVDIGDAASGLNLRPRCFQIECSICISSTSIKPEIVGEFGGSGGPLPPSQLPISVLHGAWGRLADVGLVAEH